ncbi:MAG TPA: hypothetical protein VFR34_01545 [Paracoccaceae bacterium]|nr:hypothetical protein [Paracoccaceae bacterium]
MARVLLVSLAAVVVSIVWQSIPLIQVALLSWRAEPRVVTPRGDLAADEQSTIALIEAARVVYVSTAERVIDPWTPQCLRDGARNRFGLHLGRSRPCP